MKWSEALDGLSYPNSSKHCKSLFRSREKNFRLNLKGGEVFCWTNLSHPFRKMGSPSPSLPQQVFEVQIEGHTDVYLNKSLEFVSQRLMGSQLPGDAIKSNCKERRCFLMAMLQLKQQCKKLLTLQ